MTSYDLISGAAVLTRVRIQEPAVPAAFDAWVDRRDGAGMPAAGLGQPARLVTQAQKPALAAAGNGAAVDVPGLPSRGAPF